MLIEASSAAAAAAVGHVFAEAQGLLVFPAGAQLLRLVEALLHISKLLSFSGVHFNSPKAPDTPKTGNRVVWPAQVRIQARSTHLFGLSAMGGLIKLDYLPF